MKPFDYNAYLKNNILLKEEDEKKPEYFNVSAKKADIEKKIVAGLKSMGYEAYRDATMKSIRANKKLEKGGTLVVYISESREAYLKKVSGEFNNTLSVKISYLDVETTKKFFGLVKNKTEKVKDLTDKEGQDIDLGTTADDIPIDQSVEKILGIVKKAEQKALTLKEFTYDPQAEEDAEVFVSTPEANKAVAALRSLISRPYEDEELQDLLNMLKLTREQFLAVAQAAGMKLQSGWGGITIKDRNYNGTTPYIEYVPDTRKWWVG